MSNQKQKGFFDGQRSFIYLEHFSKLRRDCVVEELQTVLLVV